MSESESTISLEEEVKRQIAEGLFPSTVERRLLREGHPEEEVKRLVDAERQRIEEIRGKARSQAAINNAKVLGLVLVGVGLLLPWSVVTSMGEVLFGGDATSTSQNGFSPDHFIYGVIFLALSIILLVLQLLRRTHFDPDNTRDRVIFGLTTLFEALTAGWWVFALMAVIRELASASEISAEDLALLGDLAADLAPEARFGVGLFIIPAGALLLLVTSYLEIAAVGGEQRIMFRRSDPETGN
jgi:hypothetical protein